ncbi:MAG: hypothetical protein JWR34_7757 [Mycobacterium sp.]|nr:hypothetical protein [Mycobacterium sp.]
MRRSITGHDAAHAHLRIAALPPRQPAGHQVGARVHRDDVYAPAVRLVESHAQDRFGDMRVVDAEHHGRLRHRRREQRVLVVDHRDWAPRVMDETPADRAQHASANGAQASTTDDQQLRILREVNESRNDVRGQNLAVQLDPEGFLERGIGNPSRIQQQRLRVLGVGAGDFPGCGHVRPTVRRRRNDVDQGQRNVAHGGLARRPVHGVPRRRRPVDTDDDAVMFWAR